jgi:hypothetical protein
MDMSKLPKFSQTPPPPGELPPEERATTSGVRVEPSPPVASGGDIWFNVIVGIIFLLMGRSFGSYLLSTVTHQPYHTGMVWPDGDARAGLEVAYPELEGNPMMNDSAMFVFGLAVLMDAGISVMLARQSGLARPLICLGLALTVGATAYNLYVAAVLQKNGVLPLISLLAVAVGGYIAFQQWNIFKLLTGSGVGRG